MIQGLSYHFEVDTLDRLDGVDERLELPLEEAFNFAGTVRPYTEVKVGHIRESSFKGGAVL